MILPVIATIGAAVALLAAACGGGSEGSQSPSATTSVGSAQGAADATTTPATADDELSVSTASWKTDFSKHSVPLGEFQSGGPSKDGIPPIDAPVFTSVAEANEWIGSGEPVIELEISNSARAYPLQILIWHEIVNDELGGIPIAVTFCPLCNTTVVFDRRLDGRVLDFGTTGNLRNSDLVMYDRQTESWWQQFGGEAIVGELTGKRLAQLPARIVAWREFRQRHPHGEVLSRDTGHDRPYGQNPYTGYDDVDSTPFFPVANLEDDRLSPKERVVYLEHRDAAVAVSFSLLSVRGTLEVEVGGELFELEFVPGAQSALDDASIVDSREVGSTTVRSVATGDAVPFDTPFWFAVAAFRPDVEVIAG
jgi:hypothetical protein